MPVGSVHIPGKDRKTRLQEIPTKKGRIVQQALIDKLFPFFEKIVFHDNYELGYWFVSISKDVQKGFFHRRIPEPATK